MVYDIYLVSLIIVIETHTLDKYNIGSVDV